MKIGRINGSPRTYFRVKPPCPAFGGVAPPAGRLCRPKKEACECKPGHENKMVSSDPIFELNEQTLIFNIKNLK
jgi:hypothetical protein